MTDIVKQLRKHHRDVGLSDDVESWLTVAADEIERLRETIRQVDYVLELLAPENHSQTTDTEMASLLSVISKKLSMMVEEWDRAALGGKE